MKLEEIQEYAWKERIRGYIYAGVEAEMELIDAQQELKLRPDDEPEYEHKRIAIAQEKIAFCNKRIDDLTVRSAVG
jgi:hypothetical protein